MLYHVLAPGLLIRHPAAAGWYPTAAQANEIRMIGIGVLIIAVLMLLRTMMRLGSRD